MKSCYRSLRQVCKFFLRYEKKERKKEKKKKEKKEKKEKKRKEKKERKKERKITPKKVCGRMRFITSSVLLGSFKRSNYPKRNFFRSFFASK